MRRFLSSLSDRALERVAPKADAGACVAPDPWTECYHGAKLSCYYSCTGAAVCTGIGSC
jgi:hypothetical protein